MRRAVPSTVRHGRRLLPALLLAAQPALHAAPPSPPGQPSAAVDGDEVTLSWPVATDDVGVTGYNVYRDDRYVATVAEPRYVTTLDADETIFYVTAFDAPTDGAERGYSTRSPDLRVSRDGAAGDGTPTNDGRPEAPSMLAATRTGADSVRLSWEAARAADGGDVAGYNVYRDDRYVTTVAGTTFDDSALDAAASHEYYVIAFVRPQAFSPRSEVAVVPAFDGGEGPDGGPEGGDADVSPPEAVSGLRAIDVTDTRVLLTWMMPEDDRGVVGYNVYRDDRYVTTVSGTRFAESLPAGGAPLEYYIVAFDRARNFAPRSETLVVRRDDASSVSDPTPEPDPDALPGPDSDPKSDPTADPGPAPDPGPMPDPGPDGGGPSPPELDDPFADAIPSPDPDDPFGYTLEEDPEEPVPGGPPTRPKNLRLDLVANTWAEMSWAPSNDDGEVVAYEITRDDGQVFRLEPALPPGGPFDPGTYEEYEKYWLTTSFIDCNATRFAFAPGSEKAEAAPWNCAETGPRPGDDRVYTVAAIDDEGNRSAESEPLEIAYAERINAPVPYYDDLYLPQDDRFASVNDLSRVEHFIDGFDLVWADEFDQGRVDPDNWNTSLVWGDTRIINGEQQYFVDLQREPDFGYDPFDFTDEELVVGAVPIDSLDEPAAVRAKLPPVCEEFDPTGLDRCEFLSGALSSHDKFSFIYGYVEGRLKASPTAGALSSFYLYHRYPGGELNPRFRHGPEIDIVEYLGENPFGDEDAFQTYHFIDPNTDTIRSSPTMNHEKNPDDPGDVYGGEYHTFGVLWEPQLVVWYIDGREVKRLRGPQVSRQPMNIVNYLVTGSGWAPTPDVDDPSIFPIEMGVDYIRVYQRETFKSTARRGP